MFLCSLHTLSHKILAKKNYEFVSHFVGEEIDSITQEINSKVGFKSELD